MPSTAFEVLSALKVVTEFSAERPFLISLDGRSGVGKSVLADWLARGLGPEASVVQMDDFFAGGEADEWSDVSGEDMAARVIDCERVLSELIRPLKSGETARWYPFDWENMAGLAKQLNEVGPGGIIIIEGAYSGAPQLSGYLDATVLATVDEPVRLKRMQRREGEARVREYAAVWGRGETFYFDTVRRPEDFSFLVDTGDGSSDTDGASGHEIG